MPQRQILIAVGAAVLLTATALVAVNLTDSEGDTNVAAVDLSSTTTTERATTTSTVEPSTTTTEATTSTEAPATTDAPAATAAPPSTSPPAAPPTTVQAAAAPPAPPFQSSIQTVTREQLGSSWNDHLPCPDPSMLRALNVSHWGYDGAVHQGRIIVAASHAERIVAVFRDLYDARFPIQRMVPVEAYGADDQASMRANNTSGFNCRVVAGSKPPKLSQHGLGLAIDVNPLVNPYVKGGSVDPPEGAPYANRNVQHQGMIRADDVVVRAFARQGWSWGGYWSSGKDYQHFSASGT